MDYPANQTISDVKKNVTSNVSRAGSEIKSEAKSIANRVERKVGQAVSELGSSAESAADSARDANAATPIDRVITSALSLLPVKNADEMISMLQTTVKDIQSNVITARDSATAFVRKYPVYSLLGAIAIGAGTAMYLKSRGSNSARSSKYNA